MYFFAFFKNPEPTIYRDIPRYTDEDAKDLAAVYASDPLWPGIRFGDLYERHMSCVLVPLEEYVLEKCFYKRAILIGDSFHKVCIYPLTNMMYLTTRTDESTGRTGWEQCNRVSRLAL